MAWADDYTAASDLALVSSSGLFYQLFHAVYQRRLSLGDTLTENWTGGAPGLAGKPFCLVSGDSPEDGDWSLRYLQDWVESACTSFVRDAGEEAYDGQAEIEMFTLATLRIDAGLNAGGFTRHVPDGEGGYDVAYGKFQVGDAVGYHLFNELKHCLQLLVALKFDAEWWDRDPNPAGRDGSAIDFTWAGCKTSAEGDFASNGSAAYTDNIPAAMSYGMESGGGYYALLTRTRLKPRCEVPYGLAVTVGLSGNYDLYVVPAVPPIDGADFDGNGDVHTVGVLNSLVGSVEAVQVGADYYARATDHCFSATTVAPAWCDEPASGEDEAKGYYLSGTPQMVLRPSYTYGA